MLRLAHALADVLDEQRQIRQALAQRRELDAHLRDAEEEIAAEAPRVHLRAEIAPRRREHAHVDRLEGAAAHALHLLLAERAQELGLQVDGQLAELVEEERPAVGLGERALAPLGGPGERAFLVAEEDALGERRRDAAAVDHDERRRPCWSLASWMALATSSLPVPVSPRMSTDERRVRDLLEHAEDAPHLGAVAHQRAEAVGEPDVDLALGLRLDDDARAADRELAGRGHDGLAHAHRAEERAVRAAEVLHEDPFAHRAKLAVERAHLGIVDDDAARRHRAR